MNILKEIVKNKQKELGFLKSNKEEFKKIFSKKNANILGEIKLSSPSFDLSKEIDLKKVFEYFGENKDIKGISVLIDETYFSGDIKRGYTFKKAYKKPIFFKEFIIEKRQIDGAYYFGYDAVLLLKRVLKNSDLIDFIKYSNLKNIFPIVEIDNEEDLKKILKINLDFGIGVNCRNLQTMEINKNAHFEIYEKFKNELKDKIVFAFSGINDLNEIKNYKEKYNGVLIGTYFMKKFRE